MPIEVVYYMFSKGDLKKRLQFQLISQCAPFLKGIKVTSILNIEEKGREELSEIFEGTDISYEVLTTAKGRCLVMFYREETLKEHLQKSDVQEFLEPYGYFKCGERTWASEKTSRTIFTQGYLFPS